MKKMLIILTIFMAIAAMSCTKQPEQVFCTADAKLCPDGSYVGRDASNNCEFFSCTDPNRPIPVEPDGGIGTTPPDDKPIPVEPDGGIGLTNPYVKYASTDKEECTRILFQCIPGSSAFSDDTGCGCKADEPKKYVSKDLDECSRIRYMCAQNFMPFSDEDGCGCEFTFGEDSEGAAGTKLAAVDCRPEQRNQPCTKEYMPVCGWFGEDAECESYPCAATYGNKCEACSDEKVISYTEGECSSPEEDIAR